MKLRSAAVTALLAALAATASADSQDAHASLRSWLAGDRLERREIAATWLAQRRVDLLPGLVDLYFFVPAAERIELRRSLEALAGARPGERYRDWVKWLGARQDLVAAPGYLEWKADLLARIDPAYRKIFYRAAPARLRLEEVIWGGVGVEGIPALDHPPAIAAAQAGALRAGERIFGLALGGEARAYPERMVSWHEMVNDRIGGEPVTVAFCTLCRSAVAYRTRTPAGGAYEFGTSGLLYRSNKLMVDRATFSLWNQFTGAPVVGRLAQSPIRLEPLPLSITTWGEWRRRHPATTAVVPSRGLSRASGFDYSPGAADRQRRGVEFPVWLEDQRLEGRTEVFGLVRAGAAVAVPVDEALRAGLAALRVGTLDAVLIADGASGELRAYESDGLRFERAGLDEIRDETGRAWKIGEHALLTREGEARSLSRLAGQRASWFAWFAFHPETQLVRLERR